MCAEGKLRDLEDLRSLGFVQQRLLVGKNHNKLQVVFRAAVANSNDTLSRDPLRGAGLLA